MDLADLYRDGRHRLLGLARSLSDEEAHRAVGACPGWTVKDVFAHLTGITDDALAGRMDNVATEEWTDRQVTVRAGATLAQVCDEWVEKGPPFEALLAGGGPPQVVIDLWTHEQDTRAAVGRPGGRDAVQVPFSLDMLTTFFARDWAASERAPMAVVGQSGRWVLGTGEPVATLQATDYELVRAFVGRRSRAQLEALGWEGDSAPFIDHLHVFAMPGHDLHE